MNKRKLLLVASALLMVAILGFGGTLAYLTDYETATNVFTVGNVDITLNEVFEENAKLIPGIDVQKEITVTNVGSEEAYIRVHFAIPTLLDSGKPEFEAFKNTLHWNFGIESMQKGEWNWHATYYENTADKDGDVGYPGNGGNWHTYTATVEDIEYTVYVATWTTPLAPNAETDIAVRKVYLDASLDNVHIEEIIDQLGEIKILVAAEAVQAAGFGTGTEKDPYDAYGAFDAAHTDANKSDGKDIVNLPANLIEHIYATEIQKNASADTNANDK